VSLRIYAVLYHIFAAAPGVFVQRTNSIRGAQTTKKKMHLTNYAKNPPITHFCTLGGARVKKVNGFLRYVRMQRRVGVLSAVGTAGDFYRRARCIQLHSGQTFVCDR
jgi:hypothetical protein